MLGARLSAIAATILCACTLGAIGPSVRAQSIDFSLNVFFSTPANMSSAGTWELVAKSNGLGIAGVEARVKNIATATERAPRATVNSSDPAGFNLFQNVAFPTFRDLVIGQTPIDPLTSGNEQGAFYGVGQFTNGSPDYPGKAMGVTTEGPAFTSLTSPLDIPWAATADPFGDSSWATAARLASGTFTAGSIPAFVSGSSGNVFTSLGDSTTFGTITAASAITAIVRTNFAPSADYNHNGIVDAADYAIWRKQNNTSVPSGTGADGTNDGMVNQADLDLWRAQFGRAVGSGSGSLFTGAVPEPGIGALMIAGALLFMLGSRGWSRHAILRPSLANNPICKH